MSPDDFESRLNALYSHLKEEEAPEPFIETFDFMCKLGRQGGVLSRVA